MKTGETKNKTKEPFTAYGKYSYADYSDASNPFYINWED